MVFSLVACSTGGGDPAEEEPTEVLSLSFDESTRTQDGATAFANDRDPGMVGRVEVANGGAVVTTPGLAGRGSALRFPDACAAQRGCARGLVEIEHSADLNPGPSDFSYGASVLLEPDQTAEGSNVVQKGRFGTEGGQWKLQVDTLDGRPSCVVRDADTVVSVRSPTSVADSRWHPLVCSKDASGLTISVDGDPTHEQAALGDVANELPVRIGSAGLGDGDDQFHGSIDDVFLTVRR